jgi:hypothetical protein
MHNRAMPFDLRRNRRAALGSPRACLVEAAMDDEVRLGPLHIEAAHPNLPFNRLGIVPVVQLSQNQKPPPSGSGSLQGCCCGLASSCPRDFK